MLDRVPGGCWRALATTTCGCRAAAVRLFPRTTSGQGAAAADAVAVRAGTYRPNGPPRGGPRCARSRRGRPGTRRRRPASRAQVRGVLREIWAKELGIPRPSSGPDRFAELGRGSLKAMEALAEL
ncbi:hypothetical protein GCM10023238_39350 [Streptomyces heliomycini]